MPINKSDRNFFESVARNTEGQSKQSGSDINTIRDSMRALEPYVDTSFNIDSQDINITCKDGHLLRLRYYQSSNNTEPLVIFFPGNGFIYDLFEANHSIVSKIVTKVRCHAVMVDYRLAPEYPYPNALEDALEAVHYIIEHADKFKADKNKIILMGYSSGANLAAVITNMMRNNSQISIYHQFLISGAYDYTNSLHEYDEYGMQDKLLSPEEAQFSFNSYCNEGQRKDPHCSPYWEKDLSGLPPTTIMVAEYDGGRSQSEGYAKKLISAGNKVTKIILPGQTHSTILFRKALSDGIDPAFVIADNIKKILASE